MKIKIIEEQLVMLMDSEEISKPLYNLAGFYLCTLENLKGYSSDKEYTAQLKELYDLLLIEKSFNSLKILDCLLAASFYYKQYHFCTFGYKRFKRNFDLTLHEAYRLILQDYFMETEEEDLTYIPEPTGLFDELKLTGGTSSFPKASTWKMFIEQYQLLNKNLLLRELFSTALKTDNTIPFMNRYSIVGYIHNILSIMFIIPTISIILCIGYLLFRRLVETPIMTALNMESYRIETNMFFESFVKNIPELFHSHGFCIAITGLSLWILHIVASYYNRRQLK